MKPRSKTVGIYYIGEEQVRLVLRLGDGAEFYKSPRKGEISKMVIGANSNRFNYVVGRLLHETLESVMGRMRVSYQHEDQQCWTLDRFVFFFDHAQFAEMAQIAGEFIHACYPDFKKAWHQFNRKPKKKAKGKTKKH